MYKVMLNLMSIVMHTLSQNHDILSDVTSMEAFCFLNKVPLFCNAFVLVTSCIGEQDGGILFEATMAGNHTIGYHQMSDEDKKAYHKAYYQANKEKLLAMSKERYEQNRDRELVRRKEYHLKHREKHLAYARQYWQDHKERMHLLAKEYNKTHKKQNKHARLLKQYGISLNDYEKMLEDQCGVCAICKSPPNGEYLQVDHDHDTGAVRKLLCNNCNISLGHAKEDVKILERMIMYILEHKKRA